MKARETVVREKSPFTDIGYPENDQKHLVKDTDDLPLDLIA